jgi:hypothetical protein
MNIPRDEPYRTVLQNGNQVLWQKEAGCGKWVFSLKRAVAIDQPYVGLRRQPQTEIA